MARRDFVRKSVFATAGAAAFAAGWAPMQKALAFPPDSFYDTFNLARMIYHENPVGPSPAAIEAVARVIDRGPRAASRHQAEDEHELVHAILEYNDIHRYGGRIDAGNVMVTLGSGEGLTLTADAFVAGGTLVGEWPAYRIIRERVWQAGGTVVDVGLDRKTWQPDYKALKTVLNDHPKAGLIHFNAQNNPMGSVLQKGEFDAFARWVFEHHPHTVILVDESDREFMEPGVRHEMPDFLEYVARGDNLVHLQTFSHIFGLTGLRVGYLMAPRHLMPRLEHKRIARPTNVFGHAAALASLKHPHEQIHRSWKNCHEGRRYLYRQLDKMGLPYVRSQGHYVMIDTQRSGTAVWMLLIAQGVLTRYGREWGLESYIRVNPGLPDENKRFIASLKAAMGQPDPNNLPTPPIPPKARLGLDKLLPKNAAGQALAVDLEKRFQRDVWLENVIPEFTDPVRVVSPSDFRR